MAAPQGAPAPAADDVSAVLPAGKREISQSDETFFQAVLNGTIPKPELQNYNSWQNWRKGAGRRATAGREDPQETRTNARDEGFLWRAVMERYYGADWREELQRQEIAAAEQRDAEEQEAAEAEEAAAAERAAVQARAAAVAAAQAADGAAQRSSSKRPLRKV